MARIRNIKPAFFMDEDLCELPALHRILFAGLWTLADKHGNLEDRPKFIRISVLPYDECDIVAMLDALVLAGFLRRYAVSGRPYLHIPNFNKHQRISGDEAKKATDVPTPDDAGATSSEAVTKQSRSSDEAATKQRRSSDEAATKQRRSSHEGGVLSTEYGVLTTDNARARGSSSSESSLAELTAGQLWTSVLELLDLWRQHGTGAPTPAFAALSGSERRTLRDALKRRSLSEWEATFRRAKASAYLAGRDGTHAPMSLWRVLERASAIESGEFDARPVSVPREVPPSSRPELRDVSADIAAVQREQALAAQERAARKAPTGSSAPRSANGATIGMVDAPASRGGAANASAGGVA